MTRGCWRLGIQLSLMLAVAIACSFFTASRVLAEGDPGGAGIHRAVLPLTLGSEWVYRDTTGETTIRVASRELFAGIDCYRVDWAGVVLFQSEYWQVKSDGVYVVGRRVMDQVIRFATPYLLLMHGVTPGKNWEAPVSSEALTETLHYSVEAEEEVATPAGSFRALPVSVRGKTLAYRRWYAPEVGMVKETTFLPDGSLLDEKVLVRWGNGTDSGKMVVRKK